MAFGFGPWKQRKKVGGTPAPEYTLRAPTYSFDMTPVADGFRLVAGDPNANAGLVATNPGDLGWSAVTSTGGNNSRFNPIVHAGRIKARTANVTADAVDPGTYILSPGAMAGNKVIQVEANLAASAIVQLLGSATNERNAAYVNFEQGNLTYGHYVNGVKTQLVQATPLATKRTMGGGHGSYRQMTDAWETLTLITFGGTMYVRRGPGYALHSSAGTAFTDPGGQYAGIATRNFANIRKVQADVPETFMRLTGTIRKFYPKVRTSAATPITEGAARITFTGVYLGTAPTRIEWALFDPATGAMVKDWVKCPIADHVIGSGNFSITVNVPCGLNGRRPYSIGVRPVRADGTSDALMAAVAGTIFSVTLNVGIIGQSNHANYGQVMTNGGYADYPGGVLYAKADPPSVTLATTNYLDSTGYWADTTENTLLDYCCVRALDWLSSGLNVPVSFEILAIPATGAGNQNPLSPGANASYLQQHHAYVGGAYDILVNSQGENEFPSGGSSWLGQWVTNAANYRSLSGQPSGTVIPFFNVFTGRNPGGTGNSLASVKALREGQEALPSTISDSYWCHHYVGCPMADGLHYTKLLTGGYDIAAGRLALSVLYRYGLSAYDGMGPIAATAARAGVVITIGYNLNGATSMTCRDGNNQNNAGTATALTSWEVSADDFATTLTISSAQLVGNQVVITLAADPGGPVKVRNHYGDQPDVTNWAAGAYTSGLMNGGYICSKPIITPLVSN